MAQDNNQDTKVQPGPAQTTNGTSAPAATNGTATNGAGGAPSAGAPPAAPVAPAGPSVTQSPVFRVIALVVIILALIYGIKAYIYNQNHVSTDDAYVTGDLVNISPIISGTLSKLTVDEGDTVKAGQVIAVLDQSGPLAAFHAAQAAYLSAQSEIPQAQTNLTYQAATVTAGISQARAALAAQNAKTMQQEQQVDLTAQTTGSQVLQAQAQAAAAYAQYQTAQAQLVGASQAIETSRNAASAAQEQINSAQASYTKAHNDEARYSALYGNNGSVAAVTAEQLDAATQASQTAEAQLASAKDQYQQAQSSVLQARASAGAAQAVANAALKQYHAALAQIAIAKASQIQVPVQKFGVANNAAVAQQNSAELQAAIAGQSQVVLKKQMVTTAQADAEQAKAALENAQVTLDDCTISAPSDGTVVRKGVNVGDALSPGQTVVTMTRGDAVWVEANFKETQLQYVRPGQPAEVQVDAYNGIVFHGIVQSINEASGNTTSLLPADNATGNFTKVVQRIPVKIVFPTPSNPGPHDATAEDIQNLRQGMSVEADIDISSARH